MGYSTEAQVTDILANALTRGTTNTPGMPVNIINIGDQVRDSVSSTTFVQYIRWADEEIDSALSVIYQTPLKRIVKGEFELLADVTAGDLSIFVEDTSRFLTGDMVNVTDRLTHEKKIVDTVVDETEMTVTIAFGSSFLASGTVLQRVGYPDPVSLASARFAAANLYDKYFASQSNVNMSDYGNKLRLMAENDLNSILNGRVRLYGQRILGRRFFNPALLDTNTIQSQDKNREKPS
jgi:hypothetical protein